MASQPIQPESSPVERTLTYDEAWDQIEALFGTAKEAYAAVGGGKTFLDAERAAWGE
jgi:hypothetical protein